jgi:hypothetical protein
VPMRAAIEPADEFRTWFMARLVAARQAAAHAGAR